MREEIGLLVGPAFMERRMKNAVFFAIVGALSLVGAAFLVSEACARDIWQENYENQSRRQWDQWQRDMQRMREKADREREQAAKEKEDWVALARSPTMHSWGLGYGSTSVTRAAAESAALAACARLKNATDCTIVATATNGWCLALALGGPSWGWSRQNNLQSAQSDALARCNKDSCKITEAWCTRR
jgi:hypothetical protein